MQENCDCHPSGATKLLIGLLIIMAILFLGILSWNAIKAHNYIGVSEEQKHSITVSGEGEVVGTPDIAKIQLGYTVEKKTVAEAQADNTKKMNAVIEKIKDDFKIDKKDIKTTSYNISPRYDWNEGKQTLRAYQVSQNLSIKIRDLTKISSILDAVGGLGLNQIGNLSFEIDNPESLREEARIKALKAAKEKAEKLADVVGVKLGRIISFSESSSQPSYPVYRNDLLSEAKAIGGGAPEIEAGSTEITIIASIEYEIL